MAARAGSHVVAVAAVLGMLGANCAPEPVIVYDEVDETASDASTSSERTTSVDATSEADRLTDSYRPSPQEGLEGSTANGGANSDASSRTHENETGTASTVDAGSTNVQDSGSRSDAGDGNSPPTDPNACPALPSTPCVARLYENCEFGGKEICLEKEGYYDSATLATRGLTRQSLSSIRVTDGYYARLYVTNSTNDGWDVVKRGSDACLADDTIDNTVISVKIERRTYCAKRPRVFMAMHGSNDLAKATHDNQWTYVRQYLDGIWHNDAGISIDEEASIYRKIKARVMIQEQDRLEKTSNWTPLSLYTGVQGKYPDLKIVREAMAIYKGYEQGDAVSLWNANDVTVARAEYVTHPGLPASDRWQTFKRIYAGWQPFPFVLSSDPHDKQLIDNTDAEKVFNEAQGQFVECGGNACRAHLRRALLNAIRMTHTTDRPFIWFNGYSDSDPAQWFQFTKNQYYMLEAEKVLRPNDVVMIINYWGKMPKVPEADARGEALPTATGTLYWLLHQ